MKNFNKDKPDDVTGTIIGAVMILLIMTFLFWTMFSIGELHGRRLMQKEAVNLGLGEWVIVMENDSPSTKFQWLVKP